MLKNSAIQAATGKLASASLLSGSLVLVGGVVAWRLWQQQKQLQTKTSGLSNELKDVKKQLAEIKIKANKNPADSLSSSFKKLASLNPWASNK